MVKKQKKPTRTTNLEVSEIVEKHNITTLTQLYHVAQMRREDSEKDLMNFVFSRTKKQLEEIIEKTYRIKEASSALEVLTKNSIYPVLFASAIHDLLIQGR